MRLMRLSNKKMKTTNVQVNDLNYNRAATEKYDDDIQRVIPGYEEMHREIEKFVCEYSRSHNILKMADLGIGTGLTSKRILKLVPTAELVAVDFSDHMIKTTKKRLALYNVKYLSGDYSEIDFGKNYSVVTSVIGIHHQNTNGKKKVFQKIYNSLEKGGVFIFGDLVTCRNKEIAAYNDARHYALMVQNSVDDKSLKEWAYHHRYLNDLAPLEDQIKWLKDAGFKNIQIKFQYLNTALIIAEK